MFGSLSGVARVEMMGCLRGHSHLDKKRQKDCNVFSVACGLVACPYALLPRCGISFRREFLAASFSLAPNDAEAGRLERRRDPLYQYLYPSILLNFWLVVVVVAVAAVG